MIDQDPKYKDLIEIITVLSFAGAVFVLGRLLEVSIVAWLPTLLLLVFYVLVSIRIHRMESLVRRVSEHSLDIIEGEENVEAALTEAIKKSRKFIKCIGGKTRFAGYLASIEREVQSKGVVYQRILNGRKMSRHLKDHCLKLLTDENVNVLYMTEENLPAIVITDTDAFLGLTARHGFTHLLKFLDPLVVQEFSEYFAELLTSATLIKNLAHLASLPFEED